MIYKAESIFTGYEMLHDHALAIEDGIIKRILPAAEIKNENNVNDLGNILLAPSFIDIQLYGAHNRLLSVFPDAETVREIVKYCATGWRILVFAYCCFEHL
jgi:N-acetylglucosamine-6-phosphate deacetylase